MFKLSTLSSIEQYSTIQRDAVDFPIPAEYLGVSAVFPARFRLVLIVQSISATRADSPDTRIDHPVRPKCYDGSNDSAGEAIMPVVVFADFEGSSDWGRAEDWSVCCD